MLEISMKELEGVSIMPDTAYHEKVAAVENRLSAVKSSGKSIWIDLDNSPHVPFFRPIIQQLRERGYTVFVTARDCFQVCGLAEQLHVDCKAIGRHYGKHRIMKFLGLAIRTLQLLPSSRKARPALAVSHGSRSQLVAATLLGIPTLQIVDYEFAKIWMGVQPTWAMTPSMIPSDSIALDQDHLLTYPGIKEDVYVPSFVPDDGIRKMLGISESDILVTIRPPASEAHYHHPDTDVLFKATIEHLARVNDTRMVVLPRTDRQGDEIRTAWPELCSSGKLMIPTQVVDGLNLIWHSDLVISGGGTMNREAAALGVPVYSVFRGKIGAVDHFLADNGRMVLLESPSDLAIKLLVHRRKKPESCAGASQVTLNSVTDHIVGIVESAPRKRNR
jgi:predicted glycosyltransferase